jgi:hypothetical protein
MLKTRKSSILLLLTCALIASSGAYCGSAEKTDSSAESAPGKPILTPTVPQLILQPSSTQILRATAPGAARFEWKLQGDGKLSTGSGDTVIYTAPDRSGLLSIVTVVAYNREGASPQSLISISTAAPPAVQLEAIGIPAYWLAPPGHNPANAIHLSTGRAGGCHTGADCIQVRYTAGATWAGVFWWPSTCGSNVTPETLRKANDCSCAINVLNAGNLRTVNRLTFWARGETGGEVVEIKVGDGALCPLPGHSTGPLTLTADWKRYELDLAGLDMRRAVALFGWFATDLHDPKGATFFLDDVQFEGTR